MLSLFLAKTWETLVASSRNIWRVMTEGESECSTDSDLPVDYSDIQHSYLVYVISLWTFLLQFVILNVLREHIHPPKAHKRRLDFLRPAYGRRYCQD